MFRVLSLRFMAALKGKKAPSSVVEVNISQLLLLNCVVVADLFSRSEFCQVQ
jgi:hypothetical protein